MRRAAINYKPTVRVKSLSKLAGQAHLHFCSERTCRLVYEDACTSPGVNGRCQECRGVRRPIWLQARNPQACCFEATEQLIDKAELRRYHLAGPGPWYQCKKCGRVHGWPSANPKGEHIG